MSSTTFCSIIVPTFRHSWELDQVLFTFENQIGVEHSSYEIIIIDDDVNDKATHQVAKKYNVMFNNIRYITVGDGISSGVKNATRAGNIGARSFSRGEILFLVVDSARLITPNLLGKSLDCFKIYGPNITTTAHPYHIGKHYTDLSWTPEDCRSIMNSIDWKKNPYMFFKVAAHTSISRSGVINESTFQGITKESFIRLGGWEETFKDWGVYNIDLWRRCVMPFPENGIQEVDVPGKWGKIGIGLKSINIEDEGTFHIHHNITTPRVGGRLKDDSRMIWEHYKKVKDCIHANINNPYWGINDTATEIFL